MNKVTIEWMKEEDLNEVLRIERENFKFPWKRSFFEYDLNRPNSYCFSAKIEGKVIGYLIAWIVRNEVHLANIAVDKNYQRQGIGSELLLELIELARTKGAEKIFLEVRVSNIVAQKFYRKFEFKFAYLRKGYYFDGEDAWVMEKDLREKDEVL